MQKRFWPTIRVLAIILILMPVTAHAFERYNRLKKYDRKIKKTDRDNTRLQGLSEYDRKQML
ncbi:MAG TPA: hypothetical protein VMW78_01665 [Anaerolineae bacterium]|nr:hypothetical protein [Anaerolineae bacterium]